MRGPPIPWKRAAGSASFRASIRCAPSASPEASPATMAMRGRARCVAPSVDAMLANDATLRGGQELGQGHHFGGFLRLLGDRRLGLLERELGAVQRAVGAPDTVDALG